MPVLEDLRMKTGELLDEGLNTGALTVAEHSWRRGHLEQADSVEALESLVEDLLVPAPGQYPALARGSSQVNLLSNRLFQVAELGQRSELVTLLGTTKIDLRGLSPSVDMTIEVVSLMGDVTVEVPPGIRVRLECTPVLGDCRIDPELAGVDGSVRITGAVIMGSLRVIPLKKRKHG